ncbi:MAG: hypothetical protein JWL92_130 [Candidatus Nomurabacteria bacterium]|nr:hypothetical protein [Candidatus Nomurabacteria bacterium]
MHDHTNRTLIVVMIIILIIILIAYFLPRGVYTTYMPAQVERTVPIRTTSPVINTQTTYTTTPVTTYQQETTTTTTNATN